MSPPRRAAFGFSLIEMVIVLFLTGIILFCVAGLTDRTYRTLKFLQEKSSTMESASMACQRLAQELRETVTPPVLTIDSVTFSKVIPARPRLLDNDPNALPTTWALSYPAAQTAQIRYRQLDDRVVRQVNAERALDVATEVNTFQVRQSFSAFTTVVNTPGAYLIQLTILEDRRAVTFETVALCPGVPSP